MSSSKVDRYGQTKTKMISDRLYRAYTYRRINFTGRNAFRCDVCL